MKKNPIFILLFIFILIPIWGKDKNKSQSKTFRGAFFEVTYPKNFSVKPSLTSSSSEGYDSAFFISPDNKVKFYVFSPQWSGEATDITIDSNKEIEKDTKTETKNGMKFKWYTYQSKDGKLRSYQETTNEEETTKLIVGIEYADKSSYSKYKNDYLQFKKSIRQFAD